MCDNGYDDDFTDKRTIKFFDSKPTVDDIVDYLNDICDGDNAPEFVHAVAEDVIRNDGANDFYLEETSHKFSHQTRR